VVRVCSILKPDDIGYRCAVWVGLILFRRLALKWHGVVFVVLVVLSEGSGALDCHMICHGTRHQLVHQPDLDAI
jgi:hypothetical protein